MRKNKRKGEFRWRQGQVEGLILKKLMGKFYYAVIMEASSVAKRERSKDSEDLKPGCGFSAEICSINDHPSGLNSATQKYRTTCQPL